MNMAKANLEEDGPFVLTRRFSVAPDKVFRAWIEPAAIRIWFGQADAPGWQAEMDVRAGGRYRLVLQDSQGGSYEARGVFREVVQDRRLVFTWTWQEGAEATEALITVSLKPVDGGTELDFTLDPVADPRERDAWRADFKRLGLLLQEK
jgi:uncharacterized protein YndB with AHSA1/START domain